MRTRIGSDDARRWVRSLHLGNPFAKAVLMAVANYVNDDGTAYPGLETLHADTEIAINTITARLRWCESIGAVTISKCWIDEDGNRNKTGRGRPTSWEIRFLLDADHAAIEAAANEQSTDRPLRGAALAKHEEKTGGARPECDPAMTISPEVCQSHGEGPNSEEPISSQSVANHLPITGRTRILESEKNYPQTPFGQEAERGFQKEIGEEARQRFRQFKAGYPDGIVDLESAEAEFLKLPDPDQIACVEAVPVYAARCRKRREKSMKAHLFVRKRAWAGLLAETVPGGAEATGPSQHPPASAGGRALIALGHVAGRSPLRLGNGNLVHLGALSPAILAFAQAPPRSDWVRHKRGSPRFAAWRDFIRMVFAKQALPDLDEIDAPWDWPPRKDGSIITANERPHGELTDEDAREVAAI